MIKLKKKNRCFQQGNKKNPKNNEICFNLYRFIYIFFKGKIESKNQYCIFLRELLYFLYFLIYEICYPYFFAFYLKTIPLCKSM